MSMEKELEQRIEKYKKGGNKNIMTVMQKRASFSQEKELIFFLIFMRYLRMAYLQMRWLKIYRRMV